MDKEKSKSILARVLTGIPSFSQRFIDVIKKYRRINDNQLFIEFIILDYHAIIERKINDLLTAYISQNNLKSRKEVDEYFIECNFSYKLEWIRRCRLLDIYDKIEQKIYTNIKQFNKVRNSIAHRTYHIKGNCKYNNKDIFDETTFEKMIDDLLECTNYFENKYKTLLKTIAVQRLLAEHQTK